MSRKGRRRREARHRARQRREEQQPERPESEEDVAAEAPGPAEQEHRRHADEPVAAGAGRGRAARKRSKRRGGTLERVSRLHVAPWMIATPIVATVVVVLAVLVLTSGSSGTTGGVGATPTPDPRVVGLTPDVTFDIQAGGEVNNAFFSPNSFTANAGDVIEFVVTNTGSVSHNLRLAGIDDEYETKDDFGPRPQAIEPGGTGRLLVKIDEAGTYNFRCDFHWQVQTGTFVLEE